MYGHIQLSQLTSNFLRTSVVYISSAALFLDMSKAFDKVPHHHLLCFLSVVGISGPLLKWFESYISNHSQKVVLNGYSSTSLPVSHNGPFWDPCYSSLTLTPCTSSLGLPPSSMQTTSYWAVPTPLNKPRYLPARHGSNIQLDHIIWSSINLTKSSLLIVSRRHRNSVINNNQHHPCYHCWVT